MYIYIYAAIYFLHKKVCIEMNIISQERILQLI